MSSLSQCRKPEGPVGRRILEGMNRRHSGVTDWGLSHVTIANASTILDVGCGGGRTVQKLAALASDGKVYGIDYSATSVAQAVEINRAEITAGRVDIREGSVSRLPYSDATFDLVAAVETHYYWPNLVEDLREVLRVLRPGASLVLIAETYRGQFLSWLVWPTMMLLRARYLTVAQHRDALAAAGFADVTASVKRGKGWICVIGKRP